MIYQTKQQPIAIVAPEEILLVPNFANTVQPSMQPSVQLQLGQIFDWLKLH